MKSIAFAVFILGMMSPVLFERLVHDLDDLGIDQDGHHFIPKSPIYLFGVAAPFLIAGWLLSFSLKDKSLVWQQRCISCPTTVLGFVAHIISRPLFERLFH